MFLNIYSVGPLIIVRVPDQGVPWKKIVQAAGRILRSHGYLAKDITSIDREGLDDAKLEAAFAGGAAYRKFKLYDFNAESGEFVLARGIVQ